MALICLSLTGPAIGLMGGSSRPSESDPHSKESFDIWLLATEGQKSNRRSLEYAELRDFLERENVSGIVPAWQLLRSDADYAARCDLDAFAMPPKSKWRAIVPTLRVVRDEVIPIVGDVDVHSAWRSDALNDCVNGATQSKHLAFAALDLVVPDRSDNSSLFAELCEMHSRVGAQTQMGLGAYFDPARPWLGREGRFHIDVAGYRSWGFDYSSKSSGCRHF